jgi:hypothetical protein
MLTYVYVSDRPFAAKTGADGRAEVIDPPQGSAKLAI